MTLKMTFLGSGSAFTNGPDNFQSNVLLELNQDTLLIDAGTDIRHSLRAQQLNYQDIKNVYLTHLHCDHCGGLEWLALTTYFDSKYTGKPNIYLSEQLINDLWNKTLSGGLSTLKDEEATLGTFFEVHGVKEGGSFKWQSLDFKLVQTIHFCSNHQLMPSYGLIFTYNNTRIFYSSDTQYTPDRLMSYYEEADIIFHDCETQSNQSGVHANYSDLCQLPDHIKNKMWLYHYNPGTLPDAKKDGFQGFVTKGQCFTF